MKKILIILFCLACTGLMASNDVIVNFGSDSVRTSAWAQTPLGKFECQNDESTKNLQVLKLEDKIIYQQVLGPNSPGYGKSITSGISSDEGCFEILANQNGYVVIARSTQPPRYQVEDYAVVNFNVNPPTIVELGTGVTNKYPTETSVVENAGLLLLKYKGYSPKSPCCTSKSPKPRKHESRINLMNGEVLVGS